jgi:hypothetical protein
MRHIVTVIGNTLAMMGFAAFIASALVLIYLWVANMASWLGWVGLPLGIVTAPAAVVLPFVYWLVERGFPELYFGIWGAGIAGVVVSMGWALFGRERLGD